MASDSDKLEQAKRIMGAPVSQPPKPHAENEAWQAETKRLDASSQI
jgi:hypothetical protein